MLEILVHVLLGVFIGIAGALGYWRYRAWRVERMFVARGKVLDRWGDMLATPRIKGEPDKKYRARLSDHFRSIGSRHRGTA